MSLAGVWSVCSVAAKPRDCFLKRLSRWLLLVIGKWVCVELRAGCSLSLPTSRDYQRQTDAEFFRENSPGWLRPWQLVHALSTHTGSLLEKNIPSTRDTSK